MRASSVVKRQSTPRPEALRAACQAATSRCRVAWSASRLASAGSNASYSDAGVWVFGVVLHQHDLLGIGVVDVDQVLDAMRPVDAGAPRADLCEELAAGLVHAHLGPLGVVGLGVDRQHILHAPDELGVVLWGDAPALGQPRLEAVCFKAWRTVSYEIASTTSKATRRSPSSRNVQRLRPSGGALHASATRRASCSPSSLRRYWRSGALRDTEARLVALACSAPPEGRK